VVADNPESGEVFHLLSFQPGADVINLFFSSLALWTDNLACFSSKIAQAVQY
jgi:hypothetical protein